MDERRGGRSRGATVHDISGGERHPATTGGYDEGLPTIEDGLDELRARLARDGHGQDSDREVSNERGERAERAEQVEHVELILFVSESGASRRALRSTRALSRALGSHATLRVVDLAADPLAGEADELGIRFTPTLVVRVGDHSTRLHGAPDAKTLRNVLPPALAELLETG